MLETALPSCFWSFITSWLTPTVFFILLNLTIGAIALISSVASSPDPHHDPSNLIRSPSILHRLKSINFHRFTPDPQHNHFLQDDNLKKPQSDELPHQTPEESPVSDPIPVPDEYHQEEDNQGEVAGEFQTMDEIYSRLKGFTRSKSETEPPVRVKKSVSFRSASVVDFETVAAMEARRPATVRERVRARVIDGDAEVDAKAADFINKFKQQLKLQRLDSIKDRVWGKKVRA